MIILYTGTPGSGKSLRLSMKIYERILYGQRTIVNFPITTDNVKKRFGKKGQVTYMPNDILTPKALVEFAKNNHKPNKESQTLIAIDECALMFNSREWDKKDRKEWIAFFQLHRKLGYDIILISQNDRLIDRQIRAFVEVEQKHRALKNYNWFAKLFSFCTGGMFVWIEYWYGARLRTTSGFFRFHKKYSKIYDTYMVFE